MPSLDHLLQLRGDLLKTAARGQGGISRVFGQPPEPIRADLHVPDIRSGSDRFE
ncbi:hypothetical protein [Burkholderia glumae]|uniref:hypothetical protein n=1 Tax=Burkholderia glumae TaxID=337 RepID=UPI0012FD0DCF|nr:hypothetical protein [Burkholderia glumae]QHE11032.1 hypothetical protein GQR88_11855 [Burkholderia glumae AU6208]